MKVTDLVPDADDPVRREMPVLLRVAVLFDGGGGLARLGLEKAGLQCTGYELNPVAHHLSTLVGSGRCVLADVRDVDLSEFDAAWASPPCQRRSSARTQGDPAGPYSDDLLRWSLDLRKTWPNLRFLWVENVSTAFGRLPDWGTVYNAYQFGGQQNRNRIIGGDYPRPRVRRHWRKAYPGICPAITASEYKGCATDTRRASRFFGRRLTIQECGQQQGFEVPAGWFKPLPGYTYDGPQSSWSIELYRAVGNGVPVYMAEAFGQAAVREVIHSQHQISSHA